MSESKVCWMIRRMPKLLFFMYFPIFVLGNFPQPASAAVSMVILGCSEWPLDSASDGRSQPVVVVVVAWLPMASYGFLWLPKLCLLALLACFAVSGPRAGFIFNNNN